MSEEEMSVFLENLFDRVYQKNKELGEVLLEALVDLDEARGR